MKIGNRQHGNRGGRTAGRFPALWRHLWLWVALLGLISCSAPRITLFPDHTEELREFTLDGAGRDKVLVIPIRGMISNRPRKSLFRNEPSMVQEVVSHLRKAEKDKRVKAVVLQVNSPGGSTTASDILYREILDYKNRTGAVVVSAMMDVATSGAYYISLPADWISAHPTTVTGSVGVIFLRPQLTGLMGKVGLEIHTYKSGAEKDMGSPFRATDAAEQRILEDLIQAQGKRFLERVQRARKLNSETLDQIASARIYLADQALRLGLVDAVGYLPQAIAKAKELAALPEAAKVIVYRRMEYPDDNIYNTATALAGGSASRLWNGPGMDALVPHMAGFYYLWLPPGWAGY